MNSFYIKIIALITMLVDHTGIILSMYPNTIAMRYVGRIAFPLYAFLIAQGCFYTKNIKKYFKRLLTFAIISQIPFTLFNNLNNPFFYLNIFFTLALGVLCVYLHEILKNIELHKLIKNIILFFICFFILILSEFLNTDYGAMGVILIYSFYLSISGNAPLKHIRQMQVMVFILFILFMYPPFTTHNRYMFLVGSFALIPIVLYNSKKGKDFKLFFYLFYPVHLLILVFIKHYFL